MWKTVKLRDVVCFDKKNGKDSGLPYVGMENIASESMQLVGTIEIPETTSSSFEFDKTHVLYGRLRPYLKKVLLPNFKGQCSTEIFCLKPSKVLLRGYLAYWLLNPSTAAAIEQTSTGARMPRANMNAILDFQFQLPPLPEQERIVAKLDAAFAEIDNSLNKVSSQLESVDLILNAFSKKFMEQNKGQLVSALIGDEFSLATGGTPNSKKKEYYEDGSIRWLVSGDIHLEEIFDCSGRITEQGYDNSNAKYLPINSVLIALNGQGKTRGTVALLKCKATCNQSLVSISPNDPQAITSDYLYFNLKNRYQEIRKITSDSGNDRRGLNMGLIKKINFQYPNDLNLQNEYVNKSKALILSVKDFQEATKKKSILLRRLKETFIRQELKNNSLNMI